MLRETSVCMLTVPISSGAAASVDSGNTDDTGIGSSCPLPSPSLPNWHSDPEFGNEHPPPIPPKASRRIPPVPPRSASHNNGNNDACPIPIPKNRIPVSFNPPDDSVFTANLLFPMSCPCGRVEPSGSEVTRPSVFHPSQCETEVTNGTRLGCGSLQRIRTTFSRWFRSVSVRESYRKSTVCVPDPTRTPTLPPRSLSRNPERTSLRGISSTPPLQATYSMDQSSCANHLRRQPDQQFVPLPATPAGTLTGQNALNFTSSPITHSLRRQRPCGKSPLITTESGGCRYQRQHSAIGDSCSSASTFVSASHDATSSTCLSLGTRLTAFSSNLSGDTNTCLISNANTHSSNAVANTNTVSVTTADLMQQTTATSPANSSGLSHRPSCFTSHSHIADNLAPAPERTIGRTVSSAAPRQQQPAPVLLHHVHHIHHFHHFHHHSGVEGPDSAGRPVRGALTPLSDDRHSSTSNGSSPGSLGGGADQYPAASGRCSTAALAPVCAGAIPAVVNTNSGSGGGGCCCCSSASSSSPCACCYCSYPCSPDPMSGSSPIPAGEGQAAGHSAPPALADTLTRITTPCNTSTCQIQLQETNPVVQLRCCSSASTTLVSARGSPGSGVCCGCCTGSSSATAAAPQQRQSLQPQPHLLHHHHHHHHLGLHQNHSHHHHHHHTLNRHNLHPPAGHHQRQDTHPPRSRTAGSSGNSGTTVYCCCSAACGLTGHSGGQHSTDSWRVSATLTPSPFLAPSPTVGPFRTSACGAPRSRDSPRHSPAIGQPRQPPGAVPAATRSTASVFFPVTSTAVTTTSSSALELQDRRSSFQRSMLQLRKMGWYWGPLSFDQAQLLLAKRPDGTFLVRDSGHETYILSLSFRVRGETYHTRIEHSQGRFSFWSQPQSHSASTMVEFIEKAVAHSISGQFHYFLQSHAPGQPPVEVPLLYPLSRLQVVASLRHLTRFTILSHIRRDHIDQLPLPRGMLHYLSEKQCYVESLEAFEEAIRDRPPLPFHLPVRGQVVEGLTLSSVASRPLAVGGAGGGGAVVGTPPCT